MYRNGKAYNGSGKTQFTRGKRKGESWTERRAKAIKEGTFRLPTK